jgi:hypothetical protein
VISVMAPRIAARTFVQLLESWGVQRPLSVGLAEGHLKFKVSPLTVNAIETRATFPEASTV